MNIPLHSSVALQPFVGPWFLQFRNLVYTDGRIRCASLIARLIWISSLHGMVRRHGVDREIGLHM
jgi:hypothetical protein